MLVSSGTTSPLWHAVGIDSGIFQYMGWALLHGAVPYTDLFDHKGLLLYVLNAAGYAISPRWGVLLLQAVSLAATLAICHKALRTYCHAAWLPLAAMLFCLEAYYGHGGNYVEEWAMPLVAYPFAAYFITLQKSQRLSSLATLGIGVCAGCCCLLRLNTAAPIVGLVVYLALDAVSSRQWCYLLRSAVLIAAGWALPIVAAVSLMLAIGGWQGVADMWFANVTFNIEYTSGLGTVWGMERVKFLYKMVLPVALALPLAVHRPRYVLPLAVAMLVVVLTTGERPFMHYHLIALPLMALAFGLLLTVRRWHVGLLLVLVVCVMHSKTTYNDLRSGVFTRGTGDDTTQRFARLIAHVPTQQRDSIWSYNGFHQQQTWLDCGVMQMNRMFLMKQMQLSPELLRTEGNAITRQQPLWVVTYDYKDVMMFNGRLTKWRNDDAVYPGHERDTVFIHDHYRPVATMRCKDATDVTLWRRTPADVSQ